MTSKKMKYILSAFVFASFIGHTNAKAAYVVVDIAQDALAVVENTGVINQFMQLAAIGDVTNAIYTAQGDYRELKNRLANFSIDWGWGQDRLNAFYGVLSQPMDTIQSGVGQVQDAVQGVLNQPMNIIQSGISQVQGNVKGYIDDVRRSASETLAMPINVKALGEMTAGDIINIKNYQRSALRSSALRAYSLGIGLQADFSRFSDDVIPSLRSLAGSAENLTELTAAQTEGLNVIASEINTGNLLKASALELVSIEALKTIDVQTSGDVAEGTEDAQ